MLRLFCISLSVMLLRAETLGYFEQKFSALHFARGKWTRAEKNGCYLYSAKEDGSIVELMRYGAGNLVPFKAARGLNVTVCGDIASFEEGFETPELPRP